MDGINGITVLYAFVTIVSFSFLEVNSDSIPLLITMGLSCCAFGFFNVRKKPRHLQEMLVVLVWHCF